MSQNLRRWDTYVKEAEKEPFKLYVNSKKTILVKQPTSQQLIDAAEMAGSAPFAEQLATICGDASEEVLKVAKSAPMGALEKLLEDIMDYFGVGPSAAPEGDTRT